MIRVKQGKKNTEGTFIWCDKDGYRFDEGESLDDLLAFLVNHGHEK